VTLSHHAWLATGQLGHSSLHFYDAYPQQDPSRSMAATSLAWKSSKNVMMENFAPGALDRMDFTCERVRKPNSRRILGSIKCFGFRPYDDCKVYENVGQCVGGSASTTGFDDGPALVTNAQIGNAGTGPHLVHGIVAALLPRSGRGQKVDVAMQDGVLNPGQAAAQPRLAHVPATGGDLRRNRQNGVEDPPKLRHPPLQASRVCAASLSASATRSRCRIASPR
jgi:crotonobetainyl-CoA:carnitine CoA-transferase CaiB-like acyl-CoA transferase